VDAVVEQDHRIRDVLLEPLLGQLALAALAGDDGRDALVFQPPEEPPQLRPQDAVVLEAGKERLDGIEDDAFGAHRPDRVIEPDKQPFEVVFAGLLDFAALHAHVIDRQLLRTDQLRKIEPEGSDVAGDFLGVLLEGHEDAGLAEVEHAVDEKREAEQRLAGARPPADESRPSSRQPAEGNLVEAADAGRALWQGVRPTAQQGEFGLLLLHGVTCHLSLDTVVGSRRPVCSELNTSTANACTMKRLGALPTK